MTAVVTPTYADAQALVRERQIPRWFHVVSSASVQGRDPGPYVIRVGVGRMLTADQRAAVSYMRSIGWWDA